MAGKKTLLVVPASGLKIAAYHDLGRHLDPLGERVPDLPEYRRALSCGDVVEGDEAAMKAAKADRTKAAQAAKAKAAKAAKTKAAKAAKAKAAAPKSEG